MRQSWKILGQAMRMLARDWRAGELRVLAAALVVAVASITSVAFFADRVSRALVRDAHQMLGADLVLVSDHRWQPGIDVPAVTGRADSGDIEIDLIELFKEAAALASSSRAYS